MGGLAGWRVSGLVGGGRAGGPQVPRCIGRRRAGATMHRLRVVNAGAGSQAGARGCTVIPAHASSSQWDGAGTHHAHIQQPLRHGHRQDQFAGVACTRSLTAAGEPASPGARQLVHAAPWGAGCKSAPGGPGARPSRLPLRDAMPPWHSPMSRWALRLTHWPSDPCTQINSSLWSSAAERRGHMRFF